jgi:hypothetical protein
MLRRLMYILSREEYDDCLGWVNLMIRYVSEAAVEGTKRFASIIVSQRRHDRLTL